MRIAVVSDIHGNLLALDAVMTDLESQSPDEIWCGGDLAWGGPWGSECIQRVRDAGWAVVKGNTDVWITGDPQTIDSEERRSKMKAIAAAHDISQEDADWLINLPMGHKGPGDLLLVHGTPDSPFHAPEPGAPPTEFAPYEGAAKVVIYGHVHVAFTRRLAEGTLVCNTGSVGMPKDHDTASYLLLDVDGPEITLRHRRVSFDRRAGIAQAKVLGGPIAEVFLSQVKS